MSLSTPAVIRGSASGYTKVKKEYFTYDWVIEEFKLLSQKSNECIYSPIFRTTNNEVEWKLCLFPRSDGRCDSAEYASFDLCLHSHKSQTINLEVHADISILPIGIKRTLNYSYQARGAAWFDESIDRSALCAHDAITIHCEIELPLRIITEPIDTNPSREQAFDSQEGQLIQDFRELYKEPRFSDLVVIVGAHKFLAHKLVLATRSPVFAAMFEHKETQENLKNEVQIEKMEPDVVKAMLEFIYTDEVTNLEELAYGLLEAADKYDIQRLRSMCEKTLYKTVNKENAVEILVYAYLHNAHKLKEYVIGIMYDNLPDVVQTESYSDIWKNHPELLDQVIRAIAARKKSSMQ